MAALKHTEPKQRTGTREKQPATPADRDNDDAVVILERTMSRIRHSMAQLRMGSTSSVRIKIVGKRS